ncbi:hypothetical protein KJ870_05730 [bacterium]|nr:hypothetical protein [bacterium]MBU1434420.1 hypothetical protein [bacterium]MBU1501998.1 hypothetical protein [bacterium]
MKKIKNEEAQKILNIYRFFHKDGNLYLTEDSNAVDDLYEAVVNAINDCGALKAQLPYNEFVHPCKKVREGDAGWIGHFDERDNRRFFLSDIYDYLKLLYTQK